MAWVPCIHIHFIFILCLIPFSSFLFNVLKALGKTFIHSSLTHFSLKNVCCPFDTSLEALPDKGERMDPVLIFTTTTTNLVLI